MPCALSTLQLRRPHKTNAEAFEDVHSTLVPPLYPCSYAYHVGGSTRLRSQPRGQTAKPGPTGEWSWRKTWWTMRLSFDRKKSESPTEEVGHIAKSRHIYSQARQKLSLHARGVLAMTASQHLRRASGAIAHGVRATENARKTATVLKRVSISKALFRDELLHEKFSNMLARSSVAHVEPWCPRLWMSWKTPSLRDTEQQSNTRKVFIRYRIP